MTIDYFRHTQDFETHSAGDIIFELGDTGEHMYAVKEGEVEILFNENVLDTIGEGGIFGEMALVDSSPRSARAIAKTDCKIVVVDKHRFTFLVQETPTFALQVMHTLANRLRRMNEMI